MEILRQKVILVATADEDARESVLLAFQRWGSQVIAVSGGIEAYELARARHVDAVVTAPHLSSGHASLLLSDMRRLHHDVPVVLFGAGGDGISSSEALHRGFTAYFPVVHPLAPVVEAVARGLQLVEERKKQKVERVTVAAAAELTFGGSAVTVSAPVLNLSRGGFFVSLERDFPEPMTTAVFRLKLAKGESQPLIEGKALVRWVRSRPGSGHLCGVGMEFIEMNEPARQFLDAYVERLSR